MSVKLYNSLTRQIEEFVPRKAGKVQMFVCGPTVYDRVHLGNARTFVVFDVVARWLRHRGLEVEYVQNITDVDDKIIRRAAEEKKEWKEISDAYTEAFLADMKALGNTAVSRSARATDYIPQVTQQVKALIAKGNVYLIEGDGWYFDLTTFPDYGKLSGRTVQQADDGVSRIDENPHKRNTGDFCVWKLSKPGEPVWGDDQLGDGRPGWHIEDTAITEHFFGPQYDLHGGGIDLKFPHHEAEIAQQESASSLVPFVKYWMHSGFLQASGERMGKSKGNFSTLYEVLEQYSPEAVRFFLLSAHYRSPLEFSEKGLDAAEAAVARIGEAARKQGKSTSVADFTVLEAAMDDDFNTPKAFGAIFDAIKESNRQDTILSPDLFKTISTVFGIVPSAPSVPSEVQALVDKRQTARDAKDFTASDTLRDQLAELGYTVDDTPYGPLVKKQ